MHVHPSSHTQVSRVATIIILLLPAVLASLCLGDSTPADRVGSWVPVDAALRVLWTGTPSEKRAVAENAYFDFEPLLATETGKADRDVQRILESLRSLIRTEMDDFITYRLLNELADRDDEVLTPLFLDALKSRSPNLRSSAIHWFSEHTVLEALPELEYAWRHEDRPWVRADLMIALVRDGSRDDTEAFLDLARGKDASLATSAIRALTIIGDPQVIPFLARIARASRSNAGLMALDALARWPDSRDALDAALEASRSPHADVQRHAAGILGHFDDPAAAARIYELATSRGDSYVRATALESLADSKGVDPSLRIRVALKILREPPTQETAPTQSAAVATLRDLDDPSVLPDLAGLEFGPDDSRSHELGWLEMYLGRAREQSPADSKPGAEAGGGRDTDIILAEDEPEKSILASPSGTLTLRCWEFPDVAGDPAKFRRLPAGKETRVKDHFERDHESWARIDENDCWVPLRFIESPGRAPASQDAKKERIMVIRREFDLPVNEVESDVAQGLMDAGLLEVIEPGDEVIGVAITIDPADFDRVLLLARSCGLNETILDGEIYEIVADLAPLYRGHPVLDRFRRAPQVRGGETDEVIDLDIEELTDK